jgi:hypothetical protein
MMRPQEIKEIVRIFVDYGWPYQWAYIDDENWNSSNTYLQDLLVFLGDPEVKVRLDPDHIWDYPIETRKGLPAWHHWNDLAGNVKRERVFAYSQNVSFYAGLTDWTTRDDGNEGDGIVGVNGFMIAINPIDPDMPPSDSWAPEGKRILK